MKHLLPFVLFVFLPAITRAGDAPKPVKVFILAGQSNMVGQAKIALAEYQAQQPATRELYKGLWKDGQWTERKDVWIKYFGVKGNLAVGYGKLKSIGPEVGFGAVVGDRYDEQVLLIKTAWGGRSVYRDFRPPSAGLPSDKLLEKLLANLKKQKPNATLDDVKKSFGATYREMVDEVEGTLANLKKYFPDYAGQGYELAGFVWFQGWNDMIDATATAEYTANLTHFIRDVRKELKAPKLPFVIGEMGVDGVKPGANILRFKAAQSAVLQEPEFKGNVAVVKTDVFWDTEAEAIFKKGWRENLAEWNKVGSDYPYHYLGSPRTMLAIGRAFGEAVLELRGEQDPKAKGRRESNGMCQMIPLSFFLADDLRDLEKKVMKNPKEGELLAYAFFKELLRERVTVELSASSAIDANGLRIESLCDPFPVGMTGFNFQVPGRGRMYGELSVKWADIGFIRSYQDKKDLGHGRLVFEARISQGDKELTVHSIRHTERFVILDQPTDPEKVYLLDDKSKIIAADKSR